MTPCECGCGRPALKRWHGEDCRTSGRKVPCWRCGQHRSIRATSCLNCKNELAREVMARALACPKCDGPRADKRSETCIKCVRAPRRTLKRRLVITADMIKDWKKQHREGATFKEIASRSDAGASTIANYVGGRTGLNARDINKHYARPLGCDGCKWHRPNRFDSTVNECAREAYRACQPWTGKPRHRVSA